MSTMDKLFISAQVWLVISLLSQDVWVKILATGVVVLFVALFVTCLLRACWMESLP